MNSAPRFCWQRQPSAHASCRGFVDRLQLDEGLSMAYCHYQPRRELREPGIAERDIRSLTIAIALEGSTVTHARDGSQYHFRAGHSTVALFSRSHGERFFPAGQQVRQLRLIIDEPLMEQYALTGLLSGRQRDNQVHSLFSGQHGSSIQQLAERIATLHGSASSGLEIQIAALTLLAEQARLLSPPPVNSRELNGVAQDRLARARELLQQHYDRPLTVAWLCTQVGTNEFALKQGFRALFNTTPHRMLTEIRMAHAWELLESGLHVSTVAWKVGYQHLSSFSAAFQRFYGRTPTSVSGKRQT
ncbi:helix-turn-helix transcriptional regulator [Erwinia sp. S43]|uniref:helix-turn-helix transcriptional regulator n=1 Tax=Erwinia sp. S43 TaxID=2769339 RepID=UPI00190E53CD|nr:AraC family transcriptional regulator [Erwinia sp. S43]MBK0033476.1 helix-turn-helix transcriptional regulator [Erwinia sp. S43]